MDFISACIEDIFIRGALNVLIDIDQKQQGAKNRASRLVKPG